MERGPAREAAAAGQQAQTERDDAVVRPLDPDPQEVPSRGTPSRPVWSSRAISRCRASIRSTRSNGRSARR